MKRIYVNEKWCLGCHLCEYYCAFANSGKSDMVKALKNIRIHPRIHIEEGANGVHFAVNCRHCADSPCVQGSSWGWDRNGVWVDRGCRADFLVY